MFRILARGAGRRAASRWLLVAGLTMRGIGRMVAPPFRWLIRCGGAMVRSLFAAAVAATALVLGAAVVSAQTPTPDDATETPTQTPTPDGVPAAPTDVDISGGVLTWTDNADNEDGYRVTIVLRAPATNEVRTFEFELPPDTERFVPPEETRGGCPDFTSVRWIVVAFNAAGDSEDDEVRIEAICPGPTPDIMLPDTGAGPARGDAAAVWLLIGLSALGAGGLAAAGARRLRRR